MEYVNSKFMFFAPFWTGWHWSSQLELTHTPNFVCLFTFFGLAHANSYVQIIWMEPKQTREKKNTECNSHPAPLNNETYLNGFNDDSF